MEQKIKQVEDKYEECLEKAKRGFKQFVEEKEKLYKI